MAQLPPAPAPAVPLVVIAYDLRDGSNANASLAPPNIVELPPSARISHLQQAVFDAARALLPERYSYLNLDVYPPGSTDWTDRSAAAKPRSTVASLLPQTAGADDTFVVIARPLPSFGGARASSSSQSTGAAPSEPRLVRVERASSARWPVFRCMFTTPRGLVIPDCEVLVDTGNLRCDLLLPVREIVKLQLTPLPVTRRAKPIDSKAITIRQFEQLVVTMVFKDADGNEYPRTAALEVFGNDDYYQAALKRAADAALAPPAESAAASHVTPATAAADAAATAAAAAAPPAHLTPELRAAVHPPVNELTPIKHMGGTGNDRVIVGDSGMDKLSLRYDAKTSSLSLLDEPVWEL